MKRIFIALKIIPEEKLVKFFSELRSNLAGERITWVDLSNLHLTVVFLGDKDDNAIKKISETMGKTCSGFGEFELKISGTGVFRSYSDPRVLWAGIENGNKLLQLSELINNELTTEGIIEDTGILKPHITLGRIKSLRDTGKMGSIIDRYKNIHFQDVDVSEVILYQSILRQTGPQYLPIGKFSLL